MSELRRHIMMQPVSRLVGIKNSVREAYIRIEDIPLDSTCGISIEFGNWINYLSVFSSSNYKLARIAGNHGGNGIFLDYGFEPLFYFSSIQEYYARKKVYYNYLNNGKIIIDTDGYERREYNLRKRFNTQSWTLFSTIINNSFAWSSSISIYGNIEITKGSDVYKVLQPVDINGAAYYADRDNPSKLYGNSGTVGKLIPIY